jgi:hypothetical protein
MLVECLIKREGPTPVELGKTRYMFMPIPDPNRRHGEPSTSVCEINAEEHLEFLLKSKQFRPYQPGQILEETPEVDLSGYSIVKHQEGKMEGYRIENSNVKPKVYAGGDGVWKKSLKDIVPFDTEFNAWQWLREEVQMESREMNDNTEE